MSDKFSPAEIAADNAAYAQAAAGINQPSGDPDVDRIHVRGFNEQGTTTTPFQMVVLNSMSRFHLAAEAIRYVPRLADRAPALIAQCEERIAESVNYAQEHLEDQPEIRDWVWTE